MKNFIQILKRIFYKADVSPVKKEHRHDWKYQYSTGNANDGKSQVSKCDCGKWAVRHFGQAEIIILK